MEEGEPPKAEQQPTNAGPEMQGDRDHEQRERPFAGTFSTEAARSEPRSWKPIAAAVGAVVLVVLVLLLVGRGGHRTGAAGGHGLQPDSPYAASLPVTGVQMSDASNMSGGKQTYLDGTITNRGRETLHAITIQLAFPDSSGGVTAGDQLPLNLIRMREPYVDVQPVSANPIRPGESREFRVIFDAPPDSWTGAYPAVHVIAAQ